MINSIKKAISDKLIELYPDCKIYDENTPQSFEKPSFLITLTGQDYSKCMNEKFKSILSFDVAFFSNAVDIKNDCLNTQLRLLRGFGMVGKYRILNKKAAIKDNVLHLTFDIRFYEINSKAEVKMQHQKTNSNL